MGLAHEARYGNIQADRPHTAVWYMPAENYQYWLVGLSVYGMECTGPVME